ncbi:hypothetical protein PC39_15212 [Salinisphaera sp. PC39]|uniref:HepT-like ribonuclease domain-containing protein n=1 Tax=Salinisphaera sp. PC39 TaxID=1304156 RepID=UPI0033425E79
MSRDALIVERLEDVLEALERIPRRFTGISTPEDFYDTAEGQDRLDAICMVLVGVGEAFKQVDRKTDGKLLARYPGVDWTGVKGVRDVIAHGYFDVDAEQVFAICRNDIPVLIETVLAMLNDLADDSER